VTKVVKKMLALKTFSNLGTLGILVTSAIHF
jgi:hypothetical protein